MSTSRRTWQLFESRAAAFFGAKRKVLSGSAGRDDTDGSDSTHPRLNIECKLRAKHSVYRIWDQIRNNRWKNPVVICLQEKNRPGFMVCVRSDDFAEVCAEYLTALDVAALERFEAEVRTRRLGLEDES